MMFFKDGFILTNEYTICSIPGFVHKHRPKSIPTKECNEGSVLMGSPSIACYGVL